MNQLINNSNYLKPLAVIFFWLAGSYLLGQPRDITLENALEIARSNSPDIQRAQLNLERSRELLNAQNAALKSQFRMSITPFTFDRSREFNPLISTFNTSESKQSSGTFQITQPIVATDGSLSLQNRFSWVDATSEFQNGSTENFSNNLFLTYSQPLFTFNRTRLDLESVELDLENANINYQIQLLILEQSVAQSFYNVYSLKMRLEIAREEFNNTGQSYEIIKNKVDAGLVAREELYQAQLNLTSSRSTVQNNRVSLENALDEFKQLIGLEITDEITVSGEISQEAVKADLPKALQNGLDRRYELRQRNIDIQNAEAALTRAGATNEFRGSINLTYGIIGNNEDLNLIYDNPSQNQNFSISFEIPLWDWGEQRSRIRAAQSSVANNNLSLAEERKNIMIGIRQAFRNLENQAIQIDIARQNVEIAQLTYDINLERYENGDLTSMDLNLFQTQLSEKKIGLSDALINYKLALLDLKVKSLYDFEKNTSIVPE